MWLMDERTEEILVARDPTCGSIELRIGNPAADDARVIHLTNEEARRLAALILFQIARLERPRVGWGLPHPVPERISA